MAPRAADALPVNPEQLRERSRYSRRCLARSGSFRDGIGIAAMGRRTDGAVEGTAASVAETLAKLPMPTRCCRQRVDVVSNRREDIGADATVCGKDDAG